MNTAQNSARIVTATEVDEQKIRDFLMVLKRADSVVVGDSPLLGSWDTDEFTGVPDSELVYFSWIDVDAHQYSVKLTESGISKGVWTSDIFKCEDSEGDPVEIAMHKHLPLTLASLTTAG